MAMLTFFPVLDRHPSSACLSSCNPESTSDQKDTASHANFIELDRDSAVEQHVPIATVGLPMENTYWRKSWLRTFHTIFEMPETIPSQHTGAGYFPDRDVQQYSTHQQQPQCYLEPRAYRSFATSTACEGDGFSVAKNLLTYEPLLMLDTSIELEELDLLTHGWKDSLLRPMRPYETRKEQFATKTCEAILDLRRPQSAVTRLVRRVCRASSTPLSGQIAFFSPVLLAPSVGAVALDQPRKIQINAPSYGYWSKVLHVVRTDILSLLIDPHSKQSSQTLSTSDPQTLLLACFICTGSLALIAQARRKDIWQPYIVALCTLIATFIGAMRTVDSRVFIFGYLFWGCAIGTGGSAIFHYIKNSYAKESESSCMRQLQHRHGHEIKQAMDHQNGHAGILPGNEPL